MDGPVRQRPSPMPGAGITLDFDRLELRDASGARVALRRQAMAVLHCLARQPDRTVTKDELMCAVWPGVVVTDDSLVQCVRDIRRALGDRDHRIVQTETRCGYRLVRPLSPTPTPAAGDAAAAPVFRQDIRFAVNESDGVRIAFAASGGGPSTLVRAPHWMTHLEWDWCSAVYGPWIQRWSRHHRLIRYDPRGCGLSDRSVPWGTLDQQVRDLETVVDAAGLERFALLALSGGAAIAIRYAARHPGRVSHLLTLGGFARGLLHRRARARASRTLDALCRLVEEGWGQDNPAFRQLFTSQMFPGANAQQSRSFNELQRVACSPQEAASLQRHVADFDATADLCEVRCPTLVMHSAHDARVPFEEGRLIASMIADARLEPIDSANHTPLKGEPAFEQINGLIDEFLFDSGARECIDPRQGAARRATLRAVGAAKG